MLLLRTLTDYDYQPKTWTGALVQRQAVRGEGPSATIDCPDCGGEGKRRVRGIVADCDRCKGRGSLVVDAYTERQIGTLETDLVDRVRWVRCDACGGQGAHGNQRRCEYCPERPGWVKAPERPIRPFRGLSVPITADAPELGRGDPVIACMERRQLAGSYEELGLALGCLRIEYRHCYLLVVRVYVEAEFEEEQLPKDPRRLVTESLGYLERLMPEEIRVPRWAAGFEKRRREAIRRGRNEAAA